MAQHNGVGLGVSGGTIQSVGFVMQKKAHNQINEYNKDKSKEEQKSVLSKWIWWMGMVIYTFGGAMDSQH